MDRVIGGIKIEDDLPGALLCASTNMWIGVEEASSTPIHSHYSDDRVSPVLKELVRVTAYRTRHAV